jgi:hypothetical protein
MLYSELPLGAHLRGDSIGESTKPTRPSDTIGINGEPQPG